MLLSRVKNDIVRFGLIKEGDKVLLGLSGGMDSMCLLEILYRLQKEIPFSLEAAHLNHMIRGESAEQDAEFSKKECEKRGILCHIARCDIPTISKERSQGIEECAREERYRFFRTLHADKIAVAHHADDQAETLLMHLLRGSGLGGLCGMRMKSGDIIRPLLGISRQEIEDFMKEENLPWREDETNRSDTYFRNALRHQVMPLLEKLRPGAGVRIASCAQKVQEDQDFLSSLSEEAYRSVKESEDERCVKTTVLLSLPLPVRTRVLRKMLSVAGFVGEAVVEECEKLLWGETGKQVSLPEGFIAQRVYDTFLVKKETPCPAFSVKGTVGEEIFLPDGRVLFVGESDEEGLMVDGEKVPGTFLVRTRGDGDKFIPAGMNGNKKLKDFFIDEKIPREERQKAVVLEGETGIFALLPYRAAEGVRCTKNTKKILKITLKGKE